MEVLATDADTYDMRTELKSDRDGSDDATADEY